MKKSNKIAILGGTGVLVATISATAAACSNGDVKVDKEGSLTDVTVATTTAKVEETKAITTTKEFVTTTTEETTVVPVEVDGNDVEVSYDTTVDVPVDIPEGLVVINGNNNDVDVNIIIDAPVYSISAESVDIIDEGNIINDMDDVKDSTVVVAAETTTPVTTIPVTTAPITTIPVPTVMETTTPVTTTAPATTTAPKTTPAPETTTKAVEYESAVITVTAEDILSMSADFADYVNKVGVFRHKNYNHSKFEAYNLYSVVYLANIDYIGAEETKKLIDGKFINDTIEKVIEDSFDFYAFYTDDTVNKIMDGNTDTIDLSRIMLDRKGKKAFAVMDYVIKGFNTNKKSKNLKNYKDCVFYYLEGVTVKKGDYDYSKSIFKEDKEALSVGSDYTMDYAAVCVDELAKMYGVSSKELSALFKKSREDLSDVVRVFDGYTKDQKCYTKTR